VIFSAKCEYGIKAMLDLSINGLPEQPVQVRVIADRAEIPEGFLEQIMSDLRRAGLVESIRGAHGGYVLARPAEAINLADVIEAIDGPVTPGGCLRETPDPGSGTSIAVIQDVWLDVRDCVMDVLSTMDLAHLREKLLRKNGATLAQITAEAISGRPRELASRP
jgi:Rrf2 family protein